MPLLRSTTIDGNIKAYFKGKYKVSGTNSRVSGVTEMTGGVCH